ncbi:hypothetical protein QVG61_08050 [Thiohalobacter sp. IOR34]|uniref:hypothetical protein n=1 Tax=Thiohalobacter sp. IOR34 TaxID=3057176 RepID=UPI0025AF2845|nr:hypothetical protein [Thiohalobacter sp. IOR34]WJW74470.1 hypothetical protein QVG61_08050 [Thiohalobacter sp. IOR34]
MSVPPIVDYLVRAGHAAPSADNAQPWRFDWDGRLLRVSVEAARLDPRVFDRDSPAVGITLGAVAENMLQAAEAAGLEPELELMPEQMAFQLLLPPSLLEAAPPAELPRALQARHTNRLPFLPDPLPQAMAEGLARSSEGSARPLLVTEAASLRRLAQLVEQASRLRFQTRHIHEWFARSLRFAPEQVAAGDGLDVATFDLPPGGRLLLRLVSDWRRMVFLNRFGFHRLFAAIEAQPVRKAPAVLLISAAAGRQASFDAGRLMERIWLDLNRQGIAVQPYYVLPDQLDRLRRGALDAPHRQRMLAVEAELQRCVRLEGRKLLMMLRIGRPRCQAVRARRLPLEVVFKGKDST